MLSVKASRWIDGTLCFKFRILHPCRPEMLACLIFTQPAKIKLPSRYQKLSIRIGPLLQRIVSNTEDHLKHFEYVWKVAADAEFGAKSVVNSARPSNSQKWPCIVWPGRLQSKSGSVLRFPFEQYMNQEVSLERKGEKERKKETLNNMICSYFFSSRARGDAPAFE